LNKVTTGNVGSAAATAVQSAGKIVLGGFARNGTRTGVQARADPAVV
jgi:hypothetical protein